MYRLILIFFILTMSCSQQEQRTIKEHECSDSALEYSNKAVFLIGSNNDSALFFLKKAEGIDSLCFHVNQHLLKTYNSIRDYEKSFLVNQRFLYIEPQNPQYLQRAGILCHFLGKTQESEEYLQKSLVSYNKYHFSQFYAKEGYYPSQFYELEKEICRLLLNREDAPENINDIIEQIKPESSDLDVYKNLTQEKYINFMKNGHLK